MNSPTVYEVLKDFQPAITALLALMAALIAAITAYYVGMAKVRSDEKAAERVLARRRLALVMRLRHEVGILANLGDSLPDTNLYEMITSLGADTSPDPDLLLIFETVTDLPAVDEAWLNLEILPLQVAIELSLLRKRMVVFKHFVVVKRLKNQTADFLKDGLREIAQIGASLRDKLDASIITISKDAGVVK